MRALVIALVMVAGCGDGGSVSPLKASALAVGYSSACAVVDDGGVVCWGSVVNHLLGSNSYSPLWTTRPTRVAGVGERVTSLAMGTDSACAVTATGRVWCWGMNCYGDNAQFCLTGGDGGQFGEAALSTFAVPVPIVGLSDEATAVSVGGGFACALLSRGTVECWGAGNGGQTGNRDMSNLVPEPVSGLQHATAVSAGSSSACAITAGGSVVCWGGIAVVGADGNASFTSSAVPVQVSGLTAGVISLSVGLAETCAVTAGGAVVCWGDTNITEGSAEPPTTAVPVPVAGLEQGMAAVSVGLKGGDDCAVTQAGGVVCWGQGELGQLGNGSMATSAAPVPVARLTNGVASVSVGAGFACALTRAGRVECWGAILGEPATTPDAEATCREQGSTMPCSDTPSPVAGF